MVRSEFPAAPGEVAAFTTDSKSWDQMEQLVQREARAGWRGEIWVTVVGMIRAPESYVGKNGQMVGGYGHLGGYPA